METGNLLSIKLQKIDELELSASIQTKKGWFYVVINYKQENGSFKTVWRATKVKDVPGNKKKAKNKISEVVGLFKDELKDKLKKEYENSSDAVEKSSESNVQLAKDCITDSNIQLEISDITDSNITNVSNDNEQKNDINKQRDEIYQNMSFIEFMKESLDEFKPNIAQTTYDCWFNNYKYRLCDFFRVIPLNERKNMVNPDIEKPIYYVTTPKLVEITQLDIEDFIKWLYDAGLKGSTVDKYYEFLKLVLDRAVRRKIIDKGKNPITDVKKPHIDRYIPSYYKPRELNQLIDGCKSSVIRIPLLFAAYYGLRRSEALGIKWDAIDFEDNLLVIKHTVTKVSGNGENQIICSRDLAKTDSGYRTYPLLPELKKILIRHKMNIEMRKRFLYKNSYIHQTEEYISVNEIGELIKPNYFSNNFKILCKKLKLKKIRLHDVRHSVGTLLITHGSNLMEVKDFLGHASIRSTEIYAHLDFGNKVDSLGRLKNTLEKVSKAT